MGNWERTPFMLGGGVSHSVEVMRLMANGASSGAEGVVVPTDLRVVAAGTATVTVQPGAALIRNKVGTVRNESYVARLPTADPITIAAGGATPRYDMILVRVEDPFQAGSGFPTPASGDLQTTEYVKTIVVSNVSSTATTAADVSMGGQAVIPLARIAMAANATTVAQAAVTDLRRVAQAQSAFDTAVLVGTGTQSLTSTSFVEFPTDIASLGTFEVPEWATHVTLGVLLGNVGFGAAGNNSGAGWSANGTLRCQFEVAGTVAGPGATGLWSLNSDTGIVRTTLMTGMRKVAIPTAFQGRNGIVRVQATRAAGNAPLIWDTRASAKVDVSWHHAAAA